jgi:UPF0113 Pre-PUA domain
MTAAHDAINLTFQPTVSLSSHDASLDRGRKQARLRKACKLYRKYPPVTFPSYPCTYTPCPKGKNIVHLVDRQDDVHCFRLHKGRVYYVSEASMRLSISVARSNLISLGTCLGKFSKSGKFKLHITSLDYLAQYAKYKVSWYQHRLNFIVQTIIMRCGSNRTVKCLSYTVTTSSRHI